MEARDVAIHALPLYHSAQLHCFLGPGVYVGGSGNILGQASPQAILDAVEREGATQLFCPPTVWIALLRHPDFERRGGRQRGQPRGGGAHLPVPGRVRGGGHRGAGPLLDGGGDGGGGTAAWDDGRHGRAAGILPRAGKLANLPITVR